MIAALIAIAAGLLGSLGCLWGRPLLGLGGLALSVAALYWPRSFWDGEPHLVPWSARRCRLALLAVIAALLFFRFYHFLPPGLWGDDAINGLLAFDVLDGEVSSPFALVRHSHSFFHALTNYAVAAAFRLVGPGPQGLRLPGVMAGIVAGVSFYAALLPLFGARVALIAGLFFASSPLQIAHSKTLIQAVFGLAFQSAGVAFLVHAVERRRRAAALAAAVAFAATIYTYHAAKLAPLVALPYLLASARGGRWRGARVVAALALAAFIVCLLPAVFAYVREPVKLTGRFAGVSLLGEIRGAGNLWPLWDSLWRTLAVFHYQQGPPRYHWFGPGDEPGLNPIVAFLAVHGLVVSLRRWREPGHALLLGWFAIGMIPGVFSSEAPRGYRILLATPPLYAWAALPVVALWRRGIRRIALAALAAALVVGSLFVDFNYYFYYTYTRPDFRWMQGERQLAMARALRAHGPGWRGYVLSPRFTADFETVRFLARAWNLQFADVTNLSQIMPLDQLPDAGALFITFPGTHEVDDWLRAFYPNATTQSVYDPEPRAWIFGGTWPYALAAPHAEPVATFIAVRRDELERAQKERGPRWRPVLARYEPRASPPLVRREPPPFFNFFTDNYSQPFRAHWSAALFVPQPGPTQLEVRGDGTVETRIDGGVVAPGFPLSPGRHRIDIEMPDVQRRLRLSVWWVRPGQPRSLVPLAAWRPLRQRAVEGR